MRIAIVASPRCGNNWVRRVISESLNVPHYAFHVIEDFPEQLPSDCILNIHVLNTETNRRFFGERSCKIIVLLRHPLDIFVSILQFSRREPAVHRWLDGLCEIPKNACDLAPNDEEFVKWMCGPGAKNLLSVSLRWSTDPATFCCIKYEDLVQDPEAGFLALLDKLGVKPVNPIAAALETYSVSYFAQVKNHGWVGQPDNYLKFLTRDTCRRTRDAHADYFQAFGYSTGENADLTPEMARRNYLQALPD